jgi:hypothetical protein
MERKDINDTNAGHVATEGVLQPVAEHLMGLGYGFKRHFGRVYDGAFGEIATEVADCMRVRVVWIDLNSSPGNAWMKLYFSTEAEQQHVARAIEAADHHLLRSTGITPRKSGGYAQCPWMLDLRTPVSSSVAQTTRMMLAGWAPVAIAAAELFASHLDT